MQKELVKRLAESSAGAEAVVEIVGEVRISGPNRFEEEWEDFKGMCEELGIGCGELRRKVRGLGLVFEIRFPEAE